MTSEEYAQYVAKKRATNTQPTPDEPVAFFSLGALSEVSVKADFQRTGKLILIKFLRSKVAMASNIDIRYVGFDVSIVNLQPSSHSMPVIELPVCVHAEAQGPGNQRVEFASQTVAVDFLPSSDSTLSLKATVRLRAIDAGHISTASIKLTTNDAATSLLRLSALQITAFGPSSVDPTVVAVRNYLQDQGGYAAFVKQLLEAATDGTLSSYVRASIISLLSELIESLQDRQQAIFAEIDIVQLLKINVVTEQDQECITACSKFVQSFSSSPARRALLASAAMALLPLVSDTCSTTFGLSVFLDLFKTPGINEASLLAVTLSELVRIGEAMTAKRTSYTALLQV